MANGNFGGGTGTSADPYLVEDAKDLRNANGWKYYKQIADIDLSEYDTGEGFTPVTIDNNNGASSGTWEYDGNGFKILNLYQNRPSTHETGIFRIRPVRRQYSNYVRNFNVKNVSLINANITGKAAALFISGGTYYESNSANNGAANYINIQNCFASGQVTSIFNNNMSDQHYNTGLIGTIDTYAASSYTGGSHVLTMNNTTCVIDLNITLSDTQNKTYNIGLMGHKYSVQTGQINPYTRISNCSIHGSITVDNQTENSILNIYGITPETNGVDINNTYVNCEFNNLNNSELVNFNYFGKNREYVSNLIANHEKGELSTYDYDNLHYLTDEQMKDLTYYKNLGWTIYE